jgi:hypothetical protein
VVVVVVVGVAVVGGYFMVQKAHNEVRKAHNEASN